MTPTQREAAERLADWLHASGVVNSEVKETIALLRELLAEPVINHKMTTEPAEPHYTITWDAQGRRLVNGELAPEHRTAKPAQQPQGEPVAWWCKHPIEKGGGGFMTADEAAAQHYMHKTAGAGVKLVPLYGQKTLDDLQFEADFYRRRVQALEQWQSRMRDPERTVVCDILANGFTLDPPVPRDRYGDPGPNVRAKRGA